MLKSSVFTKTGAMHSVNEHAFYAMMSLFVVYGLVGSAIIAHLTFQAGYYPNLWIFLLLGLVIPLAGVYIAGRSDNWLISFIGYNMLLIPFGVILAPVLKEYDATIIRNAFALTALITVLMGFAGVMMPRLFEKLGTALFISLLCLVIVRIAGLFIPILNELKVIDYFAAGLFSMYIGYDMHRATRVERTLDNAVDIALSLYLDIVNLFLSALRILKK